MSDTSRCPISENADHVHRYVAGTLPPEELGDFEVHLLECAECQLEVVEGAAIRVALMEWPAEERRTSRSRVLWWAAPLAAAAALTAWFLLPARDAVTRLGQIGAPPGLVSFPVRANADSVARLVDRGVEAYRRGEYREAAGLLEAATESNDGPGLRFFLGIAQILSGSPNEAIASLEAALEPEGNPYAAEARFYLAKAWLRLDNPDSALALLHAVSPARGDVRARAEALADSVRRATR